MIHSLPWVNTAIFVFYQQFLSILISILVCQGQGLVRVFLVSDGNQSISLDSGSLLQFIAVHGIIGATLCF